MPSPLHIRIQSLRMTFRDQWGDQLREALISILQSKIFVGILSVFVFSMMVQVLTGLLLSLHYVPSSMSIMTEKGKPANVKLVNIAKLDAEGGTIAIPGEIILREAKSNENKTSISYLSVLSIESSIPLNTIRMIHRINTHVLLIAMLAIMLMLIVQVKNTQWMKGMWFVLLCIGTCLTLSAWTGYILPWDQYSSTSFSIVTGFFNQSMIAFGVFQGGGNYGVMVTDFLSRIFSFHALILPIITVFFLIVIKNILCLNIEISRNFIGFGFLTMIIVIGLMYSSEHVLYLPSDSQIPTITTIEPVWFFQPLHGIVSALPADGGFTVIIGAIIAFAYLPFIKSHTIRLILLALIAISTLYFALAY